MAASFRLYAADRELARDSLTERGEHFVLDGKGYRTTKQS
jgi:hypothetical protein